MRDRFVLLVVLGLLLTSVLGHGPPDGADAVEGGTDLQASSPWPTLGGSLTHNRTSDARLVEGREFHLDWSIGVADWKTTSFTVSANGTSYIVNSTGDLLAVGPEGNLLWTFNGPGNAWETCPFIGPDGTIYYTCTCDHLFAIYPDGTERWNISLDSGIGPSCTPPVVSKDGMVFLGVGGNKLFAVNPNGTLNWTFKVSGCIYASPAIDNEGRIVFTTAGGNVYCVTTEGKKVWEHSLEAYSYNYVSITPRDEVVICDDIGRIHCLHSNGTLYWVKGDLKDLVGGLAVSDEGSIYGVFRSEGMYPDVREIWGFSAGGTRILFESTTSGSWGAPVLMDDNQVLVPGKMIFVLGSRERTVWAPEEGDGSVNIQSIVPVTEFEFRALTYEGTLLSIRSDRVSPVTDLLISQEGNDVFLEWERPATWAPGDVNYTIFRKVDGGEMIEISRTGSTNFWDNNLSRDADLEYFLRAEMGGEVSELSKGFHLKFRRMSLVPKVLNVTAHQVQDDVLIEWGAVEAKVPGTVNYSVVREFSGEEYLFVIGSTNTTWFWDRDPVLGVHLMYYVIAGIGNEGSDLSEGCLILTERIYHVDRILVDIIYREEDHAVCIAFEDLRDPERSYYDETLEYVELFKCLDGRTMEFAEEVYPTYPIYDIAGAEESFARRGYDDGVFMDRNVKAGSTYRYSVVYHYSSGYSVSSQDTVFQVPAEEEGPFSLDDFLNENSWVMLSIGAFDLVLITVLVGVYIIIKRRFPSSTEGRSRNN